MNARSIVNEAGMSGRPEFYSGRGAILCDLNYDILHKVSNLIEKYHGKKAQQEFVKMVAGLKKASATDFLVEFYKFESRGWKYKSNGEGSKGMYLPSGDDDNARLVVGMATIVGALSG